MKRFFFIISLALCMTTIAGAQTFTQHLQKNQGKANVTVKQSHEIEELVNNANVSARKETTTTASNAAKPQTTVVKPAATPQKNNNTPVKQKNTQEQALQKHTTPQHNGDSSHVANQQQHAANQTQHNANKQQTQHAENRKPEAEANEVETPAVDMSKKVMRRSYKVNGYRVQVFAGGNSRADKIKAQNAGNAVKQAFPNQPVYVHFYSPRWICRVGNFRSYGEANSVLAQVKRMGYKQACIVSGKITVAY